MNKMNVLLVACLMLCMAISPVYAQGSGAIDTPEAIEPMPPEIQAMLANQDRSHYEVVDWALVPDSFGVAVLSSYSGTLLCVVEKVHGHWQETIITYPAVFNTNTVSLAAHTVDGAWKGDAFVVQYRTDHGNYPAYTFYRDGFGEWSLGEYEYRDDRESWRIEKDYRFNYRYIFTHEMDGNVSRFDAHHPFEGNLRSIDAYEVPPTLQMAKAMLGDALRPITEEQVENPPQGTPQPDAYMGLGAVPEYMVADEIWEPGESLDALSPVPDEQDTDVK